MIRTPTNGVSKVSVSIVILIAVVFGVSGFYFWTNGSFQINHGENMFVGSNANMPEGWPTYSNTEYGFRFAYPTGWGWKEFSDIDKRTRQIIHFSAGELTRFEAVTEINAAVMKLQLNNGFSIEDIAAEMEIRVLDSSEIRIDDKPMFLFTAVADGGIKGAAVLLDEKENIVLTLLTAQPGYFSVLDSVVASMHFDQKAGAQSFPSNIDTSNWKIFTDQTTGISIRYPADWLVETGSKQKYVLADFTSPKTQKQLETTYCEGCGPDVSLYYFPSVEDEISNTSNKFGATTLSELIEKDPNRKELGKRRINERTWTEVQDGGFGIYYTLFYERDQELFEVFMTNRDSREKVDAVENAMIESLKLTANESLITNTPINQNGNGNAASNTNTVIPEGWLTYTDPTSGITNAYPSDWVVVTPSYATVGFRPASMNPANTDWSAVYITIRANPEALDPEAFYAKIDDYVSLNKRGSPVEPRVIGGHAGLFFSALPGPLPNAAFAFTYKGHLVEATTRLNAEARFLYETEFTTITASIE